MMSSGEPQQAPKWRFTFPTSYTILFLLIALLAALTWVVPAGQYDRVMDEALGREVAVRGSYHAVDANPQTPLDVVMATIGGFYNGTSGQTRAVDVVLFTLFVGGFMGVVGRTGAIDAAIVGAMRRLNGREHWMIPILMTLFALGGTTFGMAEESLPFVALAVTVMLRAGYDSLVGVSVVLIGTTVGVLGSLTNPFSTIIGANAAGIAFTDGIELRMIMLLGALLASILFLMRYAARVKRDPSRSLMADRHAEVAAAFHSDAAAPSQLTVRAWLVLAVFLLTFGVMIWGVSTQGWWMAEMSALFLVAAVVLAVTAGMAEAKFVDEFIEGARSLLGVALIIGLARGLLVVMEDGRIMDTILHAGDQMLEGLSPVAFINGVFGMELGMAFIVPSSSGQAVLTMPIVAPLSDFAGVDRALSVTAYQAGNGVVSLFTPTSAIVMGSIAIGRIPFQRWLVFVMPLAGILTVMCAAMLSVAALLG